MFSDIPGQQAVKDIFARALREGGALSHAYLFSGPEGLGKAAFARELGVALVTSCGGCGACSECERARRGAHPDLHVLEREGDLIRVEQVEPIVADLSLKPFAASRRVWVIPDVDQLHPAAANKLLKSIEEPPAYVFFLLVSDHVERVLPTIVSRCRQVEFRALSDAEVAEFLRDSEGLDAAGAEALARLSLGSVERAARFAADARGAGRRGQYLRCAAGITSLSRGDGDQREAFMRLLAQQTAEIADAVKAELETTLSALERQFQDKRERKWQQDRAAALAKRREARLARVAARDALDVLSSWLRDLWVVACGASDVLWNCDRADEIVAAVAATPEYYARLLAVVARTRRELDLNIDQGLALQAMFARFEEVAEHA